MSFSHVHLASILAVGACVASAPAVAHHGGAIEWQDKTVGPLTGTATEFAFRFPHVVIFMDVVGDDGEIQHWAMNTRWTPTIMRQHGWTRNSVKPGDTITVTYQPHLSAPAVGNMASIVVNGEALPLDY